MLPPQGFILFHLSHQFSCLHRCSPLFEKGLKTASGFQYGQRRFDTFSSASMLKSIKSIDKESLFGLPDMKLAIMVPQYQHAGILPFF
jgi:hypothetical protein